MPNLLQITLAPRQACRQFGICRIALWDGTPPGEQQCIARAEVKQARLSFLLGSISASTAPNRLCFRHLICMTASSIHLLLIAGQSGQRSIQQILIKS